MAPTTFNSFLFAGLFSSVSFAISPRDDPNAANWPAHWSNGTEPSVLTLKKCVCSPYTMTNPFATASLSTIGTGNTAPSGPATSIATASAAGTGLSHWTHTSWSTKLGGGSAVSPQNEVTTIIITLSPAPTGTVPPTVTATPTATAAPSPKPMIECASLSHSTVTTTDASNRTSVATSTYCIPAAQTAYSSFVEAFQSMEASLLDAIIMGYPTPVTESSIAEASVTETAPTNPISSQISTRDSDISSPSTSSETTAAPSSNTNHTVTVTEWTTEWVMDALTATATKSSPSSGFNMPWPHRAASPSSRKRWRRF